ncbi:NAD-dependent epimerase/dehydratase family protein [Hymenobacter sp. 15J16-1T3B]|uniref:NAD-dependent epimerase/dehydratase family protein n=1 Tax=Hymenobacter sp. 15J16-1T3B TaxID=2886941 RepID=UPI001D118FDD|nr:NAD-dependent epimerase/dehydratase family protein [Hymenobacter sp. 15J16-1T3B]MCC3160464.1 NAD-dependent epimerase/dehydratase family protein [Hymenobacter sp. 15J16-1T3B]
MNVIVTGATGMVGEGVLLECLQAPDVQRVLVVTRKPTGRQHPKLREVLLQDFEHPEAIAQELQGYDACYFCLGVSSVGMKEPEYTRLTYDLTLGFARTLALLNPQLTFCYVSGSGTDSSGKGRQMWARVKGRTENELLRLFPNGYAFRPGFMKATPGQRNILPFYKYVAWLYPLARRLTPGFVSTMAEVGRAMLNATRHGYEKRVLEVKDIVALAHRY